MMQKKELGKINSEADFLAHKAKVAKEALKATLSSLGNSASSSLKVETWADRYPLQSTGAALLIGFSLASPFSPSKKEPASTHSLQGDQESPTMVRMQIWATLINTGADILKAVLTPYLQEQILDSHSPKS